MLLKSNGNTFHLDDFIASIYGLAKDTPVNDGLLNVQTVLERKVFDHKLRMIALNDPVESATPEMHFEEQCVFITPVASTHYRDRRNFQDYKKLLEVGDLFATKRPFQEGEWKCNGNTISPKEIIGSLAEQYQPGALKSGRPLELTPSPEGSQTFHLAYPLQWVKYGQVCAEFQSIGIGHDTDPSNLTDCKFFTTYPTWDGECYAPIEEESPLWHVAKSYDCKLVIAEKEWSPSYESPKRGQYLADQHLNRINFFAGFVA